MDNNRADNLQVLAREVAERSGELAALLTGGAVLDAGLRARVGQALLLVQEELQGIEGEIADAGPVG